LNHGFLASTGIGSITGIISSNDFEASILVGSESTVSDGLAVD
jgi:hypothetical protein